MTLAQALCTYNKGKPNGKVLNDCKYYRDYLALNWKFMDEFEVLEEEDYSDAPAEDAYQEYKNQEIRELNSK